ncbi:MAG: class I SAM-dependent methyltransferase [Planctomycetota bacterium]|nr:class I SAM-dependent methyltransferase [Planctomycetota bacterium]
MSIHVTHRDTCRLCAGKSPELVVPITATPVAGAFVHREQLDEAQECFPLDMYMCRACGHVQLLDVVDPSVLFCDDYSYASGNSPGLVRHFGEYVERVAEENELQPGGLVVEIGSNDGTFLKFFRDRGFSVLGIEPAHDLAALAEAAEIETLAVFLDNDVAEQIRRTRGPATVVAANNVFAHIDDMSGAAASVRSMLADDGVFVFEVSYLLDVIDNMLLGTIFHEHLCYHSVKPLIQFLKLHDLELIDVHRETIQGGCLICTAQPLGGPRECRASVGAMLALEQERKLGDPATLKSFSARLDEVRDRVSETLTQFVNQGKSIAGFGAARGGTLLMYHFGLGDALAFIVDDSPDKQGTFSPGHHIPVLPTSTMYERMPDYVFILAWVHAKPIIRNHTRYLEEGGKFIVFSPIVQIITRDDNPFASD